MDIAHLLLQSGNKIDSISLYFYCSRKMVQNINFLYINRIPLPRIVFSENWDSWVSCNQKQYPNETQKN